MWKVYFGNKTEILGLFVLLAAYKMERPKSSFCGYFETKVQAVVVRNDAESGWVGIFVKEKYLETLRKLEEKATE